MASEDWAQAQTHCPDGHDVSFKANGQASWTACNGCPAGRFGEGHFELWCNVCRRWWLPPGCQRA